MGKKGASDKAPASEGAQQQQQNAAKSPKAGGKAAEALNADALEPGKFPGIEVAFKVDVAQVDKPAERTKLLLATSMERRLAPGTKTLSISEYFKRLGSGAPDAAA